MKTTAEVSKDTYHARALLRVVLHYTVYRYGQTLIKVVMLLYRAIHDRSYITPCIALCTSFDKGCHIEAFEFTKDLGPAHDQGTSSKKKKRVGGGSFPPSHETAGALLLSHLQQFLAQGNEEKLHGSRGHGCLERGNEEKRGRSHCYSSRTRKKCEELLYMISPFKPRAKKKKKAAVKFFHKKERDSSCRRFFKLEQENVLTASLNYWNSKEYRFSSSAFIAKILRNTGSHQKPYCGNSEEYRFPPLAFTVGILKNIGHSTGLHCQNSKKN
ncbi:hypothetical protein IEQ34_008985 [Dendrobium chrysotoxum]|uniref:Uncharacterized protein n=1 Tax=Dendrobium chrysotoxum TaxID=161865 RepID=A0AAV7GZB2_DENCH|nr:hypothetical protein IEQ34_008985 [Dendrobium chrysotoxum]